MAYRKSNQRSSKSNFRPGDYVPTWNQGQTDTVNALFLEVMANMGVVDLKTYFDRLAGPIALCTLIGAVYGGFSGGFSGFFWYGLAGLAAPAALVWLAIAFCYCAVILGVFFLAWAAIICGFFWLMSL